MRLEKVHQQREHLEKEIRNARLREKRAKTTCQALLNELREKNLINDELKAKMDSYSGILICQCYRDSQITNYLYVDNCCDYVGLMQNIPDFLKFINH